MLRKYLLIPKVRADPALATFIASNFPSIDEKRGATEVDAAAGPHMQSMHHRASHMSGSPARHDRTTGGRPNMPSTTATTLPTPTGVQRPRDGNTGDGNLRAHAPAITPISALTTTPTVPAATTNPGRTQTSYNLRRQPRKQYAATAATTNSNRLGRIIPTRVRVAVPRDAAALTPLPTVIEVHAHGADESDADQMSLTDDVCACSAYGDEAGQSSTDVDDIEGERDVDGVRDTDSSSSLATPTTAPAVAIAAPTVTSKVRRVLTTLFDRLCRR